MRLGPHVEGAGNPVERHGGLAPEAPGDTKFLRSTFSVDWEVCFGPTQGHDFGLDEAESFLLGGLADLLAEMLGPGVHLSQQLLAESFAADTPTAQKGQKLLAVFGGAAQFHSAFKLLAASGAVFGNAVLAEQAVHAKPGGAC